MCDTTTKEGRKRRQKQEEINSYKGGMKESKYDRMNEDEESYFIKCFSG